MKSLIILVLSYVSLTLAAPYRRKQGHDWFWDDNFKDNSSRDNDDSREFFRVTTKKHIEVTTRDPDTYTTENLDTYTTEDTDTYTTEDTSVLPDYDHSSPILPSETTNSPATEESDNSRDETFQPTETIVETTVDAKSRIKAYYQERKKQAQTCKENEHIKTSLDEFGNPACQLCTCNAEGMLLCTRISCSDNDLDTKKQHEAMLQNSRDTSLILREYATGCKPGTTVEARKCSCFCVLPSVMSCPKNCFFADDELPTTSGRPLDIWTDWKTPEDYEATRITTEENEAKFEITRDDDKFNVQTDENYETKIKTTTKDSPATESNTEYNEGKFEITSKYDEANDDFHTVHSTEVNVAFTTEYNAAKVEIKIEDDETNLNMTNENTMYS